MSYIKICGLKRTEDADYVNEVHPEYAGLVFWEKSKRNVSIELAKAIRERLADDIITVGVFVDMPNEKIAYLVNEGIISCVQLHGSENAETIAELRRLIPQNTVIIKAYEVIDVNDLARANESVADMVLIDSGKGSGNTFDWNLLSGMKRDYFLAGGLNADNAGIAVEKLRPYAVDVSSGVETDGYKDREKIINFCAAVREADGRQ